jgi:hypothetical protein
MSKAQAGYLLLIVLCVAGFAISGPVATEETTKETKIE